MCVSYRTVTVFFPLISYVLPAEVSTCSFLISKGTSLLSSTIGLDTFITTSQTKNATKIERIFKPRLFISFSSFLRFPFQIINRLVPVSVRSSIPASETRKVSASGMCRREPASTRETLPVSSDTTTVMLSVTSLIPTAARWRVPRSLLISMLSESGR